MNQLATLLYSYVRTRYLATRFRNRTALLAWQDRQVQRFLRNTLLRSPFYQRYFAGHSIEQWQNWPVIDKSIMMDNFDALNTLGVRKAAAFAVALQAETSRNFTPKLGPVTVGLSSGTSGNRGLFMATDQERYRWAGAALAKVLPGALWERQRVAFFLRANSNLYTSIGSRHIQFEFFDLLDPLDQHVERLRRLQPTILVAPPSMLRQLAGQMARDRLRIKPIKLVSVAEVLDPLDEKFISTHFNQPVHQVYQCTEGFLASTCRYGVLHLHEELVAVQKEYLDETLRKFVPIITDFNRTSQPIIRYRLHDILTERATPCPCGAVTTALEQIEGRCDDLFYLRSTSGDQWIPIFPDFISRSVIASSTQIEEYRVRQVAPDQIEVALSTPLQDQWPVQQAVGQAFHRLFVRLQCQPPQLHFVELINEPGLRKRKRVERLFPFTL
ncbi:MAG: F390 synthetase-related protein [Caldilineaceae bacterium]